MVIELRLLSFIYTCVMSNSTVFDFTLFVKEHLYAALVATNRTLLSLYTFNFHFDSSPRYLSLGSALGAVHAYNDH